MDTEYKKSSHFKNRCFTVLSRNLPVAIFFLQGVGQLFPWNVFINAVSYFSVRFCGTPFELNFENWFGIGYNIVSVLCLVLMLRYSERIKQRTKILIGLAIVFTIFAGCALLVFLTNLSGNMMFYLTMISIFIISISSSLAQSGSVGFASNYPTQCMQSMMTGQAMAGLIVSITNFVAVSSHYVTPSQCINSTELDNGTECVSYETDWSTAIYFSIAALTILACILGYLVLISRKESTYDTLKSADISGTSPLIFEDSSNNSDSISNSEVLYVNHDVSLKSAVQFVLPLCLNVFLIFLVTLSVFPSTTSRINSLHVCDTNAPRWQSDLFTPLTFILFNLSDLIGRFSAGTMQFITDKALLPLTLFRFIFIPMLLFCAMPDSKLPVLFTSDFWPIFFIVLIGLTNGYLLSRCFMALSKCCPPYLTDIGGTVLILFLMLGLLMGSSLSFLVLLISTGDAS